jgi:hypothetical protein
VLRGRKTKGKKGKKATKRKLLKAQNYQVDSISESFNSTVFVLPEFQDFKDNLLVSNEISFEYSIGKRTIRRRKTLEAALTDSKKLINLYAGLVQPFIWTIKEISEDMERIIKRFDKSNMISIAKEKAADICMDNVLLSVSRDNLISAGSLSAYANNLQLAQTANRFNMARIKKFGYNLPTVLYDMVSDIAINGVAVPCSTCYYVLLRLGFVAFYARSSHVLSWD